MKFFKKNKELIIILILWLMLWAGYNTDVFRLKSLSFPINFLDLFHGLRSLLPFLAGFLAIIFLLRKSPSLPKVFFSPLGFLFIYAFTGIISSIFFSKKPELAFYWAISYILVLVLLFFVLADSKSISILKSIINLNWIVVFFIAISLLTFFLFQPGVISSFDINFLNGRPYEGLAGVPAEIKTFGMAGTRPTGLGRYTGIVAIFALAKTILSKDRKRFFWYFLFLISFFFLYFSQAKTAIFGFILGFFLIFLLKSKSKVEIFGWFLFTIFLFVLTYFYLFYPPLLMKEIVTPQVSLIKQPPEVLPKQPPEVLPKQPPEVLPKQPPEVLPPVITTLGGRTTGIWPQAWELFLKSPLIGFGFHADRIFLEGQHTHNAILQALVQTGIIGAIFFISAFIWILVILFRLLKKTEVLEKEKPFLITVAGVLAFFIIRGITESSGAFFGADWLILAPILAYLQQLNSEEYG